MAASADMDSSWWRAAGFTQFAAPVVIFLVALLGVPMVFGKLGLQFANIGGLAAIAGMALTVLT